MAGHVQLYFELASIAVQNAKAGKVRALALTGNRRLANAPEVPTLSEAGFGAVELVGWGGLSAPAATPAAVVTRLGEALRTLLANPELQARFAAMNSEAAASSPEAFGALVRAESDRLGTLAREANIRID
jgi:tripartite-type tricarboxylate transporter receptor subunit TctC